MGYGASQNWTGSSICRAYENQRHRASGLNLLVAAIILWNTTYLQRAVDHLRDQRQHPAPGDLAHLLPLGWEHINLTGDYHWETSPPPGQINFGRSAPGHITPPQPLSGRGRWYRVRSSLTRSVGYGLLHFLQCDSGTVTL